MSAPSAGADTRTRLAPASRCSAALSRVAKMPVHSSAISTPSSLCGSLAGSLMAVTLILWPAALMTSPSTVTVAGKRPCTLSYRKRWALVSIGPRSLTATISISQRPLSTIARSTSRPMRPKPLIATRTILNSLLSGQRLLSRLHDSFRRDVEMSVNIFGGPAGAEGMHADEEAVGTDVTVPALAYRRLDGDFQAIAKDGFAILLALFLEQGPTGHGD